MPSRAQAGHRVLCIADTNSGADRQSSENTDAILPTRGQINILCEPQSGVPEIQALTGVTSRGFPAYTRDLR